MFPIVIFIGKDFEHFFFLSRLFFIVVTFDYALQGCCKAQTVLDTFLYTKFKF